MQKFRYHSSPQFDGVIVRWFMQALQGLGGDGSKDQFPPLRVQAGKFVVLEFDDELAAEGIAAIVKLDDGRRYSMAFSRVPS